MAANERPQIYLITPPAPEPGTFAARLEAVLDAAPVACLRLSFATRDEHLLGRLADTCREVAHARDIPTVIETHLLIAERHGLDGVHLTDGARSVRAARKALGGDAIVGSFCGDSRHDGMTAAESGADYVAFGPVSGGLGDGRTAGRELFAWWSEMIEAPVIAEGGLSAERIADLAPVTDFFAFGEEVWNAADPAAELRRLAGLF